MASPIHIIDSHIHLYPSSEAETLAWQTPDHPLAGQRSVEDFSTATGAPDHLDGFILIEADRKNADAKDWTHPLQEISWARRIIEGKPQPGEGHTADDAKRCVAL